MIEHKPIYIGRVSKWGARCLERNGRQVLEFDLLMPSQKLKPSGHREMYCVRVSAWGPDGTMDKAVKKNDIVLVRGIPENAGKANAVMAFTKDMAIGEEEIRDYLWDMGRFDPNE